MNARIRRVLLRTRAIASKEVMHILRDPQLLGFALVMPVLLLLLFGYAVSFDLHDIPLAVVDQDRTAASRALVSDFEQAGVFVTRARAGAPEAVEPLFRRDVAKVALVIPPGFSRRTQRGEVGEAQLLLDGSDNTTAATALGYASAIALGAAPRMSASGLPLLGPLPLEARARTLFNPELESAIFLVPGLMALILVIVAVMLTALAVAREYERGSMEQLFSTPVGRLEIILGKLGPNFVLGLFQVLIVLVVGVTLFDVPIRGSVVAVFLVSAVFLMAMLMQGLLISVVTKNQMLASQVAAITTLLPALLLSGFIFPVENLPVPLQAIAAVLPARYFIEALRAIMLRGNGIEDVVPQLLPLAAFFLVMLVLATRRFQRRLA
jgi:ABC-2 type transport system permease protein